MSPASNGCDPLPVQICWTAPWCSHTTRSNLHVNLVLADTAAAAEGNAADQLPVHLVPAIGSALEGLAQETDVVSRRRRLLVIAIAARQYEQATEELIGLFGLEDELQLVAAP